MSMPEVAIKTAGLELWYGDHKVLHGIDTSVARGAITALIGPSGCGKTTMLRCFNRINERYPNVVTRGRVVIKGRNIYDPDVDLIELRKSVGMVFQRPNPLPISIRDNILYGHRLHSPRRSARSVENDVLESALRAVNLWNSLKDRLDQHGTALQLEQQQRLCIARLLPLKPEIILMDEPCSALDPEATAGIEDLMRELKGQFTIVIVTHNMAQARRVSDECAFMLLGRIIEKDRTEDLFIAPSKRETADYIEGRFG